VFLYLWNNYTNPKCYKITTFQLNIPIQQKQRCKKINLNDS
jgi:hypothetical protein